MNIMKSWLYHLKKNKRTPLKGATELGAFYPSLFCMKFETNKELLNSKEEYLLLHEYIHFLQDVSTNFGKMNMCNFYNNIRRLANTIYKKKNEKVIIPIDFSSDKYFESISKATEILRGTTSDIPKGSKSGKLGYHNYTVDKDNVKSYFIEIKNKKYYIGSDDIIENMAYLIERSVYGDNSPAPIYPYKTIEILTEQLLPQFSEDLLLVIGLCELSLTTSNPARFYFDSLAIIKQNNIQITSIDDLLQLINSDFTINYMGNVITPKEAVTETANAAIEFLSDPFKSDQLQDVKEWVITIINNAKNIRLSDPLFITRGLLTENPRNYYLGFLTTNIGFPPYMNYSQEIIMSENCPKNLFLFMTLIEFIEVFQYGKKGCGLYNGCIKNMKFDKNSHKVSSNCKTAPWKKCNDIKLCPLSILLRTWGLSTINYEYNQ